jgi:REP element-mobilizing transposase RayT
MARFACVVLTLWNLTMRDRVSDPVFRPKGPRARCGQSISIAAVYLAIKKLIPSLRHLHHGSSLATSSTARDVVLDCCLKEYGHKYNLHAALVMPTHVHLIYSPLRREEGSAYTLPEVINAIKGPAARRINALLNGKGPVWQEEFFDHVLRSNNRLLHGLEYVCQNPVGVSTEVRVPVDLGRNDSCALGAESLRPFRPPDRVKDPVP